MTQTTAAAAVAAAAAAADDDDDDGDDGDGGGLGATVPQMNDRLVSDPDSDPQSSLPWSCSEGC